MERHENLEKLNNCESSVSEYKNLSEIFDAAFELFNKLNKTDEALNSSSIQSTIKQAMNMFEQATRLVSIVDMFSSNENFEEISTENIKYFLLPALLGTLTTKICGSDNRIHIVDVAEIYFVDFLKRVKSYGLVNIEIPQIKHDESKELNIVVHNRSNAELITEMVNKRNTKIQRYQEQKDLEKKLAILEKNFNNPNIDEEVKRDYFVTLIKLYATQAIDELSSLAAERPILEHMKKLSENPDSNESKAHQNKALLPKLQPIVITRDVMQKKVYGAGYPSLPVLTVEEFYEQKVKDGEWPTQAERNQVGLKSLQDVASGKVDEQMEQDIEDIEKEKQIEIDDSKTLATARAMDEYKDTHRRGWGNRANRS